VVSNAHVLPAPGSAQPQGQLVVQVRTGPDTFQTRAAKVLDKDVFHDLTLLQIDGPTGAGFAAGGLGPRQGRAGVGFHGLSDRRRTGGSRR
jgi:hypothetical protein